jgi:hypothetical protein
LIDRLASDPTCTAAGIIDAVWGLCALTPRTGDALGHAGTLPFAIEKKERDENDKVLDKTRKLLADKGALDGAAPKHRSLSLKLLETATYLNVSLAPTLRVALDEVEKVDAEKAEISRMHAEFQSILDAFKSTRSFARGVLIGNFRVDFFDEKHKLAIDLDTLSRPIPRTLRERVIKESGVKYVVVDYWKWRTVSRSQKEQLDFVKSLI